MSSRTRFDQSKTQSRTLRVILGLTLFFSASAPHAETTSGLCDRAAQAAAQDTGVPISVLRAITRTETGRSRGGMLAPWPWTVNMEGQGVWFDTLDEAKAYVFRHFKRGARSFDVGCFQINYRWHGDGFRSIDEMFDPLANALYAARFLQDLHAETGDWTKAAGAYHSRTETHAQRYEARFTEILADLATDPDRPAILAQTAVRQNRFPLLRSGQAHGSNGSLMPGSAGPVRTFIDFGSEERG
ncbi:transglycosylase SLT domain-containing protein [Lacimonas salitolerans]|uniref:Transglycosylase SLT domain-containing protein n=1 Tax=Lacimonas salitolerans TaxID=1323750 RepID=A0ABW4EIX6_9RHOB